MKKLSYLFLFISISAFSQVPTVGLVAYYPFNGNANDASGHGNNGTVQVASLTTDRLGNANSAYRFSSGAKIVVSNSQSLQLTAAYTFSGWMNLRSFEGIDSNSGTTSPNGVHVLFAKDCDQDRLNALLFTLSAPRVYLAGATWPGSLSYFLNYTTDTWNHFAMSYGSNFVKLYLNGVLIASSKGTNDFTISNQRNLIIGGMNCANYFFNGDLDDFRFYNRALTDEEVKATFIAENGTIVSIKPGNWMDISTWSCNCIPTSANPVQVKHVVQIPATLTGYAYSVKKWLGGQVVLGSNAKLQIAFP